MHDSRKEKAMLHLSINIGDRYNTQDAVAPDETEVQSDEAQVCNRHEETHDPDINRVMENQSDLQVKRPQ